MKTMSFINFKGGCGKTTTSVNVAVGLAAKKFHVLFIDLDPQANASLNFVDDDDYEGIYNVLKEPDNHDLINENIVSTNYECLDLLPGNRNIVSCEETIKNIDDGHLVIKKALTALKRAYDYIIIDCPPAMDSILVINAIYASNYIKIPMKADIYSLDGMNRLIEDISYFKEEGDLSVDVKTIFNMINCNKQERSIIEQVKKITPAHDAEIKYQAKPITIAPINRTFAILMKKFRIANDYGMLVEEILLEGGKKQ